MLHGKVRNPTPEVVSVRTEGVATQDSREVGRLHVGHQMWQRLEMNAILKLASPTDAYAKSTASSHSTPNP